MKKAIKIFSDANGLRMVEKFIDDISSDLILTDEVYGNLLIATLEAANNAIIHGNKSITEKEVNITLERNEHTIILRVEDQGNGFDFNNIPDPTSPENIEKINGRGVFLMQRLSDKIEFHDNGRIVQLTFTIR